LISGSDPRDLSGFNLDDVWAWIAQLVEQRIENPRVGGSNPPPGTIAAFLNKTYENVIGLAPGARIRPLIPGVMLQRSIWLTLDIGVDRCILRESPSSRTNLPCADRDGVSGGENGHCALDALGSVRQESLTASLTGAAERPMNNCSESIIQPRRRPSGAGCNRNRFKTLSN